MENHQDSMTFPNRLTSGFMQRFCPDIFATYDFVEMYDTFNRLYFNGDLAPLRTEEVEDEWGDTYTVTDDIRWEGRYKRVYGKYYLRTKQIRLARHMAYDHVKVKSTLLHEMLHKYLDQRGEDDGVEGHGPNFIREAKRINDICRERGIPYRVEFYDEEITQEEPTFYAEALGEEVAIVRDLDLARRVKRVCNTAFHDKWAYKQ